MDPTPVEDLRWSELLALPLHQYPAVHTTNIDEAAAVFSRQTTPARFHSLAPREGFEWRGNALHVGSVKIVANQYGSGFRVSDASGDFFSIAFLLNDVAAAGFDGPTQVPIVKDQTTWVVSPRRSTGFAVGAGCRAVGITFARTDAEHALAALVGEAALAVPLQFESTLSLAEGTGAWLQRYTLFVTEEADRQQAPYVSPIVRTRLAETFIYGLLEGHRHNYSARLQAGRAAEPMYVRVAAEYLAANADKPIHLADLAKITGLGVRALQLGFRKHRGCTPLEFLRERRLLRARTLLLEGTTTTIAQIAGDCGFVNLGRFSMFYRERFGECPSDTRARRA